MPKQYKRKGNPRQAPITKIIRQAQAEQKRDLTNKWRFLRKIGVYQTKETAAAIRLTDSRIRAINKKFKEMQSMKKLVRGKTVHAITLVEKKRGKKTVLDYDFSPNFQFVKTKKKTIVNEGVRKTSKGYIVEKTNKDSTIRINSRGEVEETIGKMRRRRIKYKGKDLITFLDKLENGKYKFKKNEVIILYKFGSPTQTITNTQSAIDLLIQYFKSLQQQMPELVYEEFMKYTYLEVVEEIQGEVPREKN